MIKEMVQNTRHRGPDQEGFYCDDAVSLGHARLSIIDLSEKGRQPLWNEDKSIAVICNGEIYNFQEIRQDLQKKGHRFFSQSDSEVILHLYEESGERCLELLNGIFAFCVYDKKKNKLFLARDRFAVKPLYYFFDGKKFIFSSEIKGILAHPIKRVLNQEALRHHFRLFFTPAPFTLFEKIYKLSPAHYLIFRAGEVEIKKYWDISDDLPEIKTKDEAIEGIRFLLKQAVRAQLISDRPVGIFLSGGLDSSSVLAMMRQFLPGKIKTYSVGFEIEVQQEKYNRDFQLARETAQYFNTEHHELLISALDAKNCLEKVIWHLEEPVPNPIQTATFLLSQLAKKEVAVVLGGDGGDEIFGGYPRYYLNELIDSYQKLPFFLRKKVLPFVLEKVLRKEGLGEKLRVPAGVSRYLLFMGQKLNLLSEVLTQEVRQGDTECFLREHYPENKFKDKTKYLMSLDLFCWLSDESLLRSDKMTMAWGLEQRVPILDERLVEFAFRIPTKYKIRGRKSWKRIFKEAMKDYLPDYLLRQPKMGWFSPASKWLRSDLKDLAFEVLSPDYVYETKELFNFPQIKKILEDHISGRKYNLDIIWSLLTFQIWYKLFLKR